MVVYFVKTEAPVCFIAFFVMIAFDQNQIAGLHLLQDKVLHFFCLFPAVKQSSQNDQFTQDLLTIPPRRGTNKSNKYTVIILLLKAVFHNTQTYPAHCK